MPFEKLVNKAFYGNRQFDKTLNQYKKQLDNAYLLFPAGTLEAINRLKDMSDGKLMLISSDKGYTTPHELNNAAYPELDFHGSFSLMVNYHAIASHATQLEGEAFMESPRDGAIVSGVFSYGFKLSELTETSYQLEKSIENFSPTDYFNYYELMEKTYKATELKAIASTLSLSGWDPFLFELMSDRINHLFSEEDTEIIDHVINNIPKIVANFYFIPGCEDVLFSIGLLFYTIDHYQSAIKFYKLSLRYFKEKFETVYNLALCYYYEKDYHHAIKYFSQALEFEPEDTDIRKLIRSSKTKLKKQEM